MAFQDLRGEWRWLSSGCLLSFSSGFGQTFYIALYAGHLKTELLLSDGQFGSLYMLGTLTSAALLTWAGKLADVFSMRWLGAGVLAGLAGTAVLMSQVSSAWMLAVVFFGLRFFGQGMCTHVAMTAMGRWFNRKRGQAVSIAALGIPLSEAVLPFSVVLMIGLVGWRQAWLVNAGVLVFVAAPLLIVLLSQKRRPLHENADADTFNERHSRRQWSRAEMLRHPLFYGILPIVLATPFIFTAIFFNQVELVAQKGWELAWFAGNYPVMAATHVASALVSGRLIDRYGARHLLVIYLLPLGAAALLFVWVSSPLVVPVGMALLGMTMGIAATTGGALWPELYGVVHLGSIRAAATALVVLASAISPGLVGVLMDAGISLQSQILVMSLYCFAASALAYGLQPGMRRLAAD